MQVSATEQISDLRGQNNPGWTAIATDGRIEAAAGMANVSAVTQQNIGPLTQTRRILGSDAQLAPVQRSNAENGRRC
jgi:hypothetical protein